MFVFLQQAAQSDGSDQSSGLIQVVKLSWPFLLTNLAVSAFVLAVVIERIAFQLSKYGVNSKEFLAQIKKLVTAGNIDRAIKLCDAGDFPVLQLVKSGLTHANKGPDEIDAAMSEKISELKPAAEKRIGWLWSLANIATLVGLLGTVSGLIRTFSSLNDQSASPAKRQQMLSAGISEAMYNTAFGLGIAVVCMISHLFLNARSKSIQHDLDSVQERVFNMLTIQARPGGY